MTHDKSTALRIFLSSPSDVLPERNRAEAIIRKISAELSNIELQPVRWEDSYYTADKSFQEQIVKPSDCDLVVCLFWSRLGSELPPMFNRADGSGRTGTEWEFEEALDAARNREPILPDLLVYKKTIEPQFKASEAELGLAQKRALDAFWDRWFHDEKGHFVAGFDQFANTDEFAAKFEEHLREWLRRRTDGVSWDIATRGSPFRGLAPFDEAHASVFFGRATMVKRLAARLRSAAARGFPLVFVLGASGSGKSSLVRAGLIPHLRIAGVTEPLVARWRRAVTTPDSLSRLGEGNLLAGLVALLQGDGVLPELRQGDFANPRQLAGLLAASPESATVSLLGALDRWASAVQADEGHAQRPVTGLILVLDQFEEIFKLEDAERAALARAVSALVETGRVWLVATMRSDFYQALQGAPDWLALRDRGRSFDVTAPSAADVREIVLAPARAAGLRYEESGGRSLAEDLEREAAAPGVLPMLQSALEELFNERDAEGSLMTLASYDRLGGVQGVLAERAERVFGELDAQAQDALSEVLGKLADFDTDAGEETPVARAALLGDFGSGTPARRLAERLLAERLLLPVSDTAGGDENAETGAWSGHVRVAHESLFLRWPRAQRQLATDRNDLELRRRLNGDAAIHAAAVTKDAKAARTLLLDGLRLAEGRDLLKRRPDLLSAQARRFVAESDRAAKAKARRAWTIAASLITAFGLVAAFASWSAVEASRQKKAMRDNLLIAADRAHGRAMQAAYEADTARLHAYLGESLGYLEQSTTMEATSFALQLTSGPPIRKFFDFDGIFLALPLTDQGPVVAAVNPGLLYVIDVDTGTPVGPPTQLVSSMQTMAVSHDRKRIATSHVNGTVNIREPLTGKSVGPVLRVAGKATHVSFAEDDQKVITGSVNGTVQIWDAKTGAAIAEFAVGDSPVVFVKINEDGTRILARATHKILLWDIPTGTRLAEFGTIDRPITFGDFIDDGRQIIFVEDSSDNPSVLRFANSTNGSPSGARQLPWTSTNECEIDPARTRLVCTQSVKKTAHVIDLETGDLLGAPISHGEFIHTMRFSADGRRLATASDHSARIWDVETGVPKSPPLTHKHGWISSLHFLHDDNALLTTTMGSVNLWDTRSGAPTPDRLRVDGLWFDSTYSRMVSLGLDRRTLQVFNLATGAAESSINHSRSILGVLPSPNGKLLAAWDYDNEIHVWNTSTGEHVGVPVAHSDLLSSIAFSPDSKKVFSVSYGEAQGRIWEAESGSPSIKPIADSNGGGLKAMFSPSGLALAIKDWNTIQMWNPQNGEPIGSPIRQEGGINDFMFSPDGKRIVTAGSDSTARLWDGLTGQPIGAVMKHADRVNSARFDDSGNIVLTASDDSTAVLWDGITGTPLGEPIEHSSRVERAQFSLDGKYIHTLTSDHNIRLWNAASQRMIGLPVQSSLGLQSQFLPGGFQFVFGKPDSHGLNLMTLNMDVGSDTRLRAALRAISGVQIAENGQLQELPTKTVHSLRNAHDQLGAPAALLGSPLDRVMAWHLADRGSRTVSPFSSTTTAEHVERIIDDSLAYMLFYYKPRAGTLPPMLRDAYDLDSSHPLMLPAILVFENNDRRRSLLRKQAMARIENNIEFAGRAAAIFRVAGDRDGARQSAELQLRVRPDDAGALAILAWARSATGN